MRKVTNSQRRCIPVIPQNLPSIFSRYSIHPYSRIPQELTHTTLLVSKMDPIKYIFEKPALSGRIARWRMILTEYEIQYPSQKAIKGSVVADHLAHQAVDDYQSMQFEFPDEDVLLVTDCEEPGP